MIDAAGRAAFVGLLGRPSSGKSTLLNAMCGQKVSIVSAHPQTTRRQVRGIVNGPRGQLVFVDTPGYHNSERKLNRALMVAVGRMVEDVDILLAIVDASRDGGEEESAVLEMCALFSGPVVFAVNKSDLAQLDAARSAALVGLAGAAGCHPVTAISGDGVGSLVEYLFGLAPQAHPFYPDDVYTDQPADFRVSEVIREQALVRTREEVPHAMYVEVADLEVHGERLWIRAFIMVERDSQKAIVIGHGGRVVRDSSPW